MCGPIHDICVGGVDPNTHKKDGLKSDNSKARGCTDFIYLIIFAIFLIGLGIVADWSVENGDWRLMVYGGDSWGNICGVNNTGKLNMINSSNAGLDMTDRPHQYFTDPTGEVGVHAMVLCVAECPTDATQSEAKQPCKVDGNITEYCLQFCLETLPYQVIENASDTDFYPTSDQDKGPYGNGCPEYIYETYDAGILQRCIPKFGSYVPLSGVISSYVEELNAESYFQKTFQSVAAAYEIIGYCCLIAVALSYSMLVLMKCFVRPLIYSLLISGVVLLAVISYLLYERYEYYRDLIRAKEEENVLESEERNRDFFHYSSIVMIVFTSIVCLVLVALRKEIYTASTIYMESAKALKDMPTMLLSPLITYSFLISYLAFWIYVLLEMSTTDTPEMIVLKENATHDGSFGEGHVQYREDVDYWNFWWYHVFGLFWIYQFLMAAQEMSLAGCITEWFKNQQSPPRCSLFSQIYRVGAHHLGTVALGSLIIAICNLIRAILMYIKEKTDDSASKLAKFVITCCMCCFWCLEKCLQYINRNAYVEVMLYGYSFCNAAWAAFRVIVNNILQVAALNVVGSLVFFTLKLVVTAVVTIIAFHWLKDEHEETGSIPLWGIVLFIIAVATWFIAEGFTELYEMTADTLLVCFCEDRETNNGDDKPYLSPPSLVKLLHSSIKKKETKEKPTPMTELDKQM